MFLPTSTYRVQLHKDFTIAHLRNILDYLKELGVDTIYAAPILKATPGSMHGYDVTDPHMINPEIGTLEDLENIAAELRSRGMKWVQDIVPNHMAFNGHNTRLMDVLERGKYSPYFNYFDINWNHPDLAFNGKVMVPFLGKELQQCLEDQELKIEFGDDGLTIGYFDNRYPVSPATYGLLIQQLKGGNKSELGRVLEDYRKAAIRESPLDEWLNFKAAWVRSLTDTQELSNLLAEITSSKEKLSEILEVQNYRLTFWKHTEHVINYRRFFTVNSLICLNMEREDVFQEYHRFILFLYNTGLIQGVRIDHIDGLNDPSGYLRKLRRMLGKECYVIAEKILEAREEMPEHWPLEGTSGYEFLFSVNQLFTNRRGTDQLVEFYHSLLPGMPSYEEVVLLNKRLILNGHMAGELDNLVTYFFELNLQGGYRRERIKEALSSFMLSLPVYRVYPDKLPLRGRSLELIEEAVSKARNLNAEFREELEYLHSLCMANASAELQGNIILFLRRLMQFTGPLTAKGVEDTTFYIYNPLISHVEVGDSPSTLGITIQEFHKSMIRRFETTPFSLNATATHDTKRGEDARMRLNMISETPDLWISKVKDWILINRQYKVVVGQHYAPILNDEYFIYQSIVGGFPEDLHVSDSWKERLKEYMMKVVREAKVMTNWSDPNEEYESACSRFIDNILQKDSEFLKSFLEYFSSTMPAAVVYSSAQAVVKLTAPGIPDIYQGCELFDLSYVDPDNRRPVDYYARKTHLEILKTRTAQGAASPLHYAHEHAATGVQKLFVTWKCLHMREGAPLLFSHGTYLPLALTGHGALAVGYARHFEDEWCLVVIPLGFDVKKKLNAIDFSDIFISLPDSSPGKWRNIFTDESIMVIDNQICLQELFSDLPVAVLRNS